MREGFFVDILLDTGQHLQSGSYARRWDAKNAAWNLRTCMMIETMDVVAICTGEVTDRMDSLARTASRRKPKIPR